MMSAATIQELSREAARKAAKQNKTPYIVWPEDLTKWKDICSKGGYPSLPFPFIGDYVPKGFRKVKEYFVDSSGFGRPGEPALTVDEFVEKIKVDRGCAITEAGQFQVYVAEYFKAKKKEIKKEEACTTN